MFFLCFFISLYQSEFKEVYKQKKIINRFSCFRIEQIYYYFLPFIPVLLLDTDQFTYFSA